MNVNDVTLRLNKSQADLVQTLIATTLDEMNKTENEWFVEIAEKDFGVKKKKKKDLIDVLTSLVEAAE